MSESIIKQILFILDYDLMIYVYIQQVILDDMESCLKMKEEAWVGYTTNCFHDIVL